MPASSATKCAHTFHLQNPKTNEKKADEHLQQPTIPKQTTRIGDCEVTLLP
jgi:hypothetical protein